MPFSPSSRVERRQTVDPNAYDHAVEFAQIAQYPRFKTIASERRFEAVIQRIGLTR